MWFLDSSNKISQISHITLPGFPPLPVSSPKGLDTPFLMMKPLWSNPSRKETRLGQSAVSRASCAWGHSLKIPPPPIKHLVTVRNIKTRGGHPACGEQTASPAWWLGEKWLFGVHGNPTLSHKEKDVAAHIHDQGLAILESG